MLKQNLLGHSLLASLSIGLGLLLELRLDTSLGGLARVALLLVVGLGLLVSEQTSTSTADSTSDAVRDALAALLDLTSGLLLLAVHVLLAALLLQTFAADHAAGELLGRAHGLVPLALADIGVILGSTRGRDGEAGALGGSVGDVMLGLGFVLLCLALGL